jgi:hypothetical protein
MMLIRQRFLGVRNPITHFKVNPDKLSELCVIYGKVEEDGWEGRLRTFSKPSTKQISSRTIMAQFKLRYKQFPKTGMKVDVVTDDNGYWKIAL